jgi:hypothetical protein
VVWTVPVNPDIAMMDLPWFVCAIWYVDPLTFVIVPNGGVYVPVIPDVVKEADEKPRLFSFVWITVNKNYNSISSEFIAS